MYREKTRLYKVYHIHLKGNKDINEGYVGITRRSLSFRLSQHMVSKRPVGPILRALGKSSIVIDQLAILPREKALDMEYQLRPKMNMGWNCMAGGNRSTAVCIKCGKPLPKRKSGSTCIECNPTKFEDGHKPFNYGKGERYKLTSPEGEVFIPVAFTVFCREHELVPQNLRKVAKGTRRHSCGWKAERIDD